MRPAIQGVAYSKSEQAIRQASLRDSLECDATDKMRRKVKRRAITGRKLMESYVIPGLSLIALLGIATYALLGPTGIIAWTDYRAALKERSEELEQLEKRRDALRNQQKLLNSDNVDPDFAGELLRRELNVVAPDEIVVPLE